MDPLAAVLNTAPLSDSTQSHLVRVYRTLATCIAGAAVGAAFEQFLSLPFSSFLSVFLSLGTVMYFLSLPRTSPSRSAALHAAAAANGFSTGPLLTYAADVDPAIPMFAFAATASLFICLTGAALFSKRRHFLYLGGLLGSALTGMFWVGMMNMFVRSSAVFSLQLYGGLMMFMGFVVYDSQLIVEKVENGDKDHLRHAFELFTDVAALFRRILIIMAQNQERKKEKEGRGRSR